MDMHMNMDMNMNMNMNRSMTMTMKMNMNVNMDMNMCMWHMHVRTCHLEQRAFACACGAPPLWCRSCHARKGRLAERAGTDVVGAGGVSDWRLPPAATSAAVAVTTLAAAIAAVQGVGVEGPPRCLLNHRLKSLNE
jgi:hypothetical protein